MKIPTKVRYSIRFMLDLALNSDHGLVLMKDVSLRQGISEKYLGHFVPSLKNAGFITATRGSNGGFALAKDPKEITIHDIVEAVDGPICLVDCVKDPSTCKKANMCVSREFWEDANNAIANVFKSYTLSSLAERHRSKKSNWSYSI